MTLTVCVDVQWLYAFPGEIKTLFLPSLTSSPQAAGWTARPNLASNLAARQTKHP